MAESEETMGFSAGGILAGEMLLNFDGLVNGTALRFWLSGGLF